MPFELESLVGHLYIVGGRLIKTVPPGALVEVSPLKSARGREIDTFYALVLPSGTNAPVTFYEQMALMAAERYFSTGGSVTSALRDVFNTLNNNLYEHNQSGRRTYEANMICAVLRDDELFIARVGAAVALLLHEGTLQTHPENLDDDESLFQPPLGVLPIPDVQMKRTPIAAGGRLLLADANAAEIAPGKVEDALQGADLQDVIDNLKLLVTRQIQAMAVEFVPAEEPTSVLAAAGESTKIVSAELAAAREEARRSAERRNAVTGDASASPRRRPASPNVKRGAGKVVRILGETFGAIGDILQKITGREPDDRQKRLSNSAMTTIAIALPLVLSILMVISWASNVGVTEMEQCVADGLSAAEVARSLNPADPSQRRSQLIAWETVERITERCDQLRDGDPIVAALRTEAQSAVDAISGIDRRQARLLATLPDATISRLILQGFDLYALDSANSLVYRVALGEDGLGNGTRAQPITSMVQGASVDGITLGQIIDIDFGTTTNRLYALDRNGVLVNCQPQFINQCRAQRLPEADTLWQNPVGFTVWTDRVYVLDPGANQIWRYDPSGPNYSSRPWEYFNETRFDIARAVDFDISETGVTDGRVYILMANGTMMSFFDAQREGFSFAGEPEGQELGNTTVQNMYLNDSPIGTAFYIVSRPSRTIYETSIAGSHRASYRVYDEDQFELLSAVTVEPSLDLIYAASGNSIFIVDREG